MKTAWILGTCAALVGALLASPSASANQVFVARAGETTPVGTLTVQPGDALTLELRMDFIDTTVGGAAALLYEPALLRLDTVSFDGALDDDPGVRCSPDPNATTLAPCPGHPTAVAFGGLAGLAGKRTVATLELTALAAGSTGFGLSEGRPFSDTTGQPLNVTFVPEPTTPTMLAAAIAQLFALNAWRGRRQRLRRTSSSSCARSRPSSSS